jgi:hypothetical protein
VTSKIDRRTRGRKWVNILATLTHGRNILSCAIIELSEGGARIRLTDESIVVQGQTRLAAAQLGDVAAEVVWQQGATVGLKFAPPPDAAKLRALLLR